MKSKYVSRGAYKLLHAIKRFGIDVRGKVCLDSGLSTGGFAQVLLEHGAKRVYGVEVGHGQVHENLRHERRLIVMEGTDLADVMLPEPVEVVTLDLSFTPVSKFARKIWEITAENADVMVLVKPQFELPRSQLSEEGASDEKNLETARKRVEKHFVEAGFSVAGFDKSPIEGRAAGSIEGLLYLTRGKV